MERRDAEGVPFWAWALTVGLLVFALVVLVGVFLVGRPPGRGGREGREADLAALERALAAYLARYGPPSTGPAGGAAQSHPASRPGRGAASAPSGGADLSLSVERIRPAGEPLREAITVRLRVENLGPDTAEAVVVEVRSGDLEGAAPFAVFPLGGLPPGRAREVITTFRPKLAGTAGAGEVLRFEVRQAGRDPRPDNNRSVLSAGK